MRNIPKINIVLISVFSTLAVMAIVLSSYNLYSKTNTRYVSLGKIIDEFKLTKEKKQVLEQLANTRKNYLDSLGFELNQLQRKIATGDKSVEEEFDLKKDYYLEKKKAFNEENENYNDEMQKQVFTQINQYIEDFGKAEKIDVIIGASGNGNVMYCRPDLDVTNEAIKYLNKRYAGTH